MAVTKLWKVSVRLGQVLDYTTNPEKTANPEYSPEDYQALKDVLAYAKDEEKTEHEFFCDGINCNVAMARDQFITVKEQFGKTDGIQAYHGYLSFKENEVTPEQAQQIGMEFARKMWGKRFQVVVTTHLNTKHLHCHFVINSVSFVDGKRLKDKEKSWYYFRHIADEICLEHKLSIVEKPELHRSPAYLTMKDEAGMPTRYNNAKKAIDEAIAMSRNLRQFQYELGVMGYHSNFSPNRKYATVTPKGSEKPIRTYRLGEEYTKEKILERLIAKQQNTARLHYLLKDDLMKMDELTKQVTLLGKHQIGTDEQLFSYKRSVEDEIKTLTADRTHLRNEIRKVDISDERLSAAKAKISAISERLKELRKEVKLCDGIAKRSGVIADTLSQVKAEEEKSQRKEFRNYEQRR